MWSKIQSWGTMGRNSPRGTGGGGSGGGLMGAINPFASAAQQMQLPQAPSPPLQAAAAAAAPAAAAGNGGGFHPQPQGSRGTSPTSGSGVMKKPPGLSISIPHAPTADPTPSVSGLFTIQVFKVGMRRGFTG